MATVISREIRQVRDALKSEFDGLIDMRDVPSNPEQLEQHFLSRALGALVVRRLLGCDSATAAAGVVDGDNDIGIDAIAVSDSGLNIWLIQSKWSDKGKSGFGINEALKLIEGLTLIDQQEFERFNSRVRDHANQLRAAWGHPNCTITLLVATMGKEGLSQQVVDRFEKAKTDFNGNAEVLKYAAWNVNDIWQIIRDDHAQPSVKVTARMDEWIHLAEPFGAYQGRVPVSEIAQWYEQHGDHLFEQNIRKSLGLTKVNQELVDTLTNRPLDFWYFNNGITILCDTAERRSFSLAKYAPIELHLEGASVVNGAQTVAAIHTAMEKAPEVAAEAYATVKIVTTKNCPADFGIHVTRATNTQNQVGPRDFVALDPAQWAIRQDFTLSLGKDYTFKRGELDPTPDAGCSVVQAALALACAHRNTELAVRASQNTDLLWEEGSTGAYEILFKRSTPGACQIWRSVQTMWLVWSALSKDQDQREGRAWSVADYGKLIITHLVFRQLDLDGIDDLDFDWSEVLAQVPEVTLSTLNWLIHYVDQEFGPTSYISSTFTSLDRCRILVQRVSDSVATGAKVPELPAAYIPATPAPRAQRRANAVPTLIDAGRLAEGTAVHFFVKGERERQAIGAWLDEHPRRAQATWVSDRRKPLLWSYDGKRYSPTGLVNEIWEQAGWADRPVAVQGPERWHIKGEGTLWDLARSVQDAETTGEPVEG